MGTIRKLQILIAMKFEPLKTQNFIAAKLNGFIFNQRPDKFVVGLHRV